MTATDGSVVHGAPLVAPLAHVVGLLILVPADEEARLPHVLVVLVYEGVGVGVVLYVLLEVLLVLYDVVDEAPEERYVRPRPYGGVDVAHGARAREARVHVDER